MPATLKPTAKTILAYHAALQEYATANVTHETAVRSAFQTLLTDAAKANHWLLVPEQTLKIGGKSIRPDGTLRDAFNLPRGYWEAKDTADALEDEIKKKAAKGYPLTNIIFEDTRTGILYQDGAVKFRADLTQPVQVADLLNLFFAYTEPDIEGFEQAVTEFKERVPELAQGLAEIIKGAHRDNKRFIDAFAGFYELCKTSLNPNISIAAVDEMLVQHLLTERLIRKVFDNPEFTRRNVIAAEVEKVIDALVSRSFNRDEFLKSLDRFYRAIEAAAHSLEDFSEKQHFLNTVYERFFQGYSVKVADTHGIVYTPQPIVDFMCSSVVEVLKTEFGKELGDPDVVLLDPATGTGNFIVNLLRRVPKRDLDAVYKDRLFANEIMLLPYYIAALNIEHAFYDLAGRYEPFEGLCFVDTLELAEGPQPRFAFMNEKNSERVERQKNAPITVIIGNPPYNMGQANANDNNKNQEYEVIDKGIKDTYAKDSKATNVNKLSDAYVKFFRWASDRLQGRDGIVCYVSNNSFIDQIAFDGMRKHLSSDFTKLYHVDLHGNVRSNPKLSGTTHNVFGIQVGVGITVAIRSEEHTQKTIHYVRVPEFWRKEVKLHWLDTKGAIQNIEWQDLVPDSKNTWLTSHNSAEFTTFISIGNKEQKSHQVREINAIFKDFTIGVISSRDRVVYDHNFSVLLERVRQFIEDYNGEVFRYQHSEKLGSVENFIRYNKIKWSRDLIADLQRGRMATFTTQKFRYANYRPFCKQAFFFDSILNQDLIRWPAYLPSFDTEAENQIICVSSIGSNKPFQSLITSLIADFHFIGDTQCFPFYTYDTDGTNRRENITDWALAQFRAQYADPAISKWDIFYYVYGVLHHPGYREKFADALKRELPRIPYAPEFKAFAEAGRALADLHLNYETVAPYKLRWVEAKDKPQSFHVEKMKLSKDKTQIIVNETLTLADIPARAFEYRLGNRSAVEWVIDQYQVSTDKRSGITSDPNRADEPRYIVDLVGRVVAVSVETARIVEGLKGMAFSAVAV